MSEKIIYEYQTVTNEDLTRYIIENESLHKYFNQDWGKLKAKQYCGIINYDNTDYYILPKIA
ncbi:MAG: restriction endonuclease, partial [Arcobacteraceae bacterium]